MYHLLAEALHVFVVIMMVLFIIICAMAATGNFDNWGKHYKDKRAADRSRDIEDA